MEEYVLEINVDPEIILRKVQRNMVGLSLSSQVPYNSTMTKIWGVGGGIFQVQPPKCEKYS